MTPKLKAALEADRLSGMSLREIAAKHNVSKSTAEYWSSEHNRKAYRESWKRTYQKRKDSPEFKAKALQRNRAYRQRQKQEELQHGE